MDEKLKSTIDKVVRLANQNAEFGTELRKRLGTDASATFDASTETERIKRIEKYLGLDYAVDTRNSVVDYSFVKMPDVYSQLVSDNREMLRFRYGTRYHKIDFDEFCRYAHLQVEMLLNYFYDIKNSSDIKSIKDHIKRYNPVVKIDTATDLSSIAFNAKLWAFSNEMHLDNKLKELIENLRLARNEQSHRSTFKSFDADDYNHKLKEFDIPLLSDGKIDWRLLTLDHVKYNIFCTELKKDYPKYTFMLWYPYQPFDDIIGHLKDFAQIVSTKI
jgi:hypothetical protein